MPTDNIQLGPSAGGVPVGFFNTPNSRGLYVDGSTGVVAVGASATAQATKNLLDNTTASQTVVSPTVTGDAGTGMVFCKQVAFVENATSTIHTGTVTIPAGSTLLDIIFVPQVLWTGGTAALTCGDANSANGWFTTTNLKATDLILGERLQASNANNWGGVNGAYLTTAGRFGQQSTNMIGGYNPTAYSVIGVVTVGTPATTAGRLFMYVLWMVGQSVTPVLT